MKVLVIDNTLPHGTVSGWRIGKDQRLESADPGDAQFVVASSGEAALVFRPTASGWRGTWHSGSKLPSGILGRQFSHDDDHTVYSSGLGTLLEAVKDPAIPVGNALDKLIFCLLGVEDAFSQASTLVLSALYTDTITMNLLTNRTQIKNDFNAAESTVCTELCAVFDFLERGSEVRRIVESKCKQFRDSLTEVNHHEQLKDFRDFLLGDDDGHDGILQKIKSLAPAKA